MMDSSRLPEAIAGCLVESIRITAQESDSLTLDAALVFPDDFVGFDGHFPGNPIVPGIVQIMSAAYVAAQHGGGRLQAVKRCKFMRPVRPGERIWLVVERTPGGQCDAALEVDGEPCASVSFLLDAE